MKVKVGSKKALLFVVLIGIILGVMLGLFFINNKKAQADKNYIDSQKQKLNAEKIVNDQKTENILKESEVNKENPEPVETTEINVNVTMLDTLNGNTAYCPTFQIVWNEVSDFYVDGNSIEFLNGELEIANNLNEKSFTKDDISDEYYYVKAGKKLVSVKREIEDAIKTKFDEKSSILDKVTWIDDSTVTNIDEFNNYVFYSMLKRDFKFENSFDVITEDGTFNEYMYVTYFGIDRDSDSRLRDQVDVLFYNDDENFAVKLKTKDNDELILLNVGDDNFTNFKDVYSYLENEQKNYSGKTYFTNNDYLKVPNIEFNILKEFDEFSGKTFLDKNSVVNQISDAIQTIEFKLDNEGGKLKSEALMVVETMAVDIDVVPEVTYRHFYLDDEFYMFLKEDDKTKPYFALKVDDISAFQEDAKEMRYYNLEDVENVEVESEPIESLEIDTDMITADIDVY